MNTDSTRLFELLVALLGAAAPVPHVAQSQPPSIQTDTRVLVVGNFKSGEGCIAGFKRLGHNVTEKQCVRMAKIAHIEILWSQAPDGETTIIIPVNEGDPFAVIEKKGVKQYLLYKK